jgi:RNA-directed DNA polymerase
MPAVRIAHDHILTMLGTFPARGMVKQWLKAGVVEQGRLHRTDEGTPQGGVVSPVLLNVALHGMEQAAGVRHHTTGRAAGWAVAGAPVLVRYADDLVVLCHSQAEALQVKARLASWLAPRGLAFNEDKTRVVTLDEGFDFLGFNVRRHGDQLLIKPSKAALRRIRERLRTELRSLRGSNARAVIKRLNPIIRGWAAYYRGVVSSKTFSALDDYMWRLTLKWALFAHPNKPKFWTISRYFGQFNETRRDRWVFGDRDGGAYMQKFAWTRIVRHYMVKSAASPDDPALADYWAERRRKAPPLTINKANLWLFEARQGRCRICGGWLLSVDDQPQSPREWEQWLVTAREPSGLPGSNRNGIRSEVTRRRRVRNGEKSISSWLIAQSIRRPTALRRWLKLFGRDRAREARNCSSNAGVSSDSRPASCSVANATNSRSSFSSLWYLRPSVRLCARNRSTVCCRL